MSQNLPETTQLVLGRVGLSSSHLDHDSVRRERTFFLEVQALVSMKELRSLGNHSRAVETACGQLLFTQPIVPLTPPTKKNPN